MSEFRLGEGMEVKAGRPWAGPRFRLGIGQDRHSKSRTSSADLRGQSRTRIVQRAGNGSVEIIQRAFWRRNEITVTVVTAFTALLEAHDLVARTRAFGAVATRRVRRVNSWSRFVGVRRRAGRPHMPG